MLSPWLLTDTGNSLLVEDEDSPWCKCLPCLKLEAGLGASAGSAALVAGAVLAAGGGGASE